jgi:hypothetical protein
MSHSSLPVKMIYIKWKSRSRICSKIISYSLWVHKHNIIQIDNNVVWDWRYFAKYSPHSIWMCRIFYKILSVPQNIVIIMNNVDLLQCLINEVLMALKLKDLWSAYHTWLENAYLWNSNCETLSELTVTNWTYESTLILNPRQISSLKLAWVTLFLMKLM